MAIDWSDPPPTNLGRQGSKAHSAFAAELREQPKRWALWPFATCSSTVSAINKGSYVSFPRGLFEATGRRSDDGFTVWIRYVGEVA